MPDTSAPPHGDPIEQESKPIEIESEEQVKRLLLRVCREENLYASHVSAKAGYSEGVLCRFKNPRRHLYLETALCFLRALGFRVLIVRASGPLAGRATKRPADA